MPTDMQRCRCSRVGADERDAPMWYVDCAVHRSHDAHRFRPVVAGWRDIMVARSTNRVWTGSTVSAWNDSRLRALESIDMKLGVRLSIDSNSIVVVPCNRAGARSPLWKGLTQSEAAF